MPRCCAKQFSPKLMASFQLAQLIIIPDSSGREELHVGSIALVLGHLEQAPWSLASPSEFLVVCASRNNLLRPLALMLRARVQLKCCRLSATTPLWQASWNSREVVLSMRCATSLLSLAFSKPYSLHKTRLLKIIFSVSMF